MAALLSKIAREAHGKAVPLDYARLAEFLGYAPESLRKAIAKMRGRSWFFQEYRVVIFMTHERSPECPKGKWRTYAVSRYWLHRVGAKPGAGRQLRWHQRKGKERDWNAYMRQIFLWAEAIVFRGMNRRDGKYKASPIANRARAGGARAPNSSHSASRRWGRLAAEINSTYRDIPRAESIDLHGWAVLRLREWHDRSDIIRCLVHATDEFARLSETREIPLAKRKGTAGNAACAWICSVAKSHLDVDGLVVTQRKTRNRERDAGRFAPTFNEGIQAARPLRLRKIRR